MTSSNVLSSFEVWRCTSLVTHPELAQQITVARIGCPKWHRHVSTYCFAQRPHTLCFPLQLGVCGVHNVNRESRSRNMHTHSDWTSTRRELHLKRVASDSPHNQQLQNPQQVRSHVSRASHVEESQQDRNLFTRPSAKAPKAFSIDLDAWSVLA